MKKRNISFVEKKGIIAVGVLSLVAFTLMWSLVQSVTL